MAIREIKDGDVLLARYISAGDLWAEGLKFFSDDGDYQQIGTWKYDEGKILQAHVHNIVKREVLWTQEVLFIFSGKLEASIYNTNDVEVEKLIAGQGDLLVLLNGGHGYKILEKNTKVLEVKNGPYFGAERDRRRLNRLHERE